MKLVLIEAKSKCYLAVNLYDLGSASAIHENKGVVLMSGHLHKWVLLINVMKQKH